MNQQPKIDKQIYVKEIKVKIKEQKIYTKENIIKNIEDSRGPSELPMKCMSSETFTKALAEVQETILLFSK